MAKRVREAYYHVTDGERVRIPKKNHKNQCCDCGLVHIHDYSIIDGHLEITVRVDRRATAAVRRERKRRKEKCVPVI